MPVHDPVALDAVILGAGVTGLVTADILLKHGAKDILVIDEYDDIGGNHINIDCGPYTYDIGTFIFQDDSPLLFHFPELLPLYHPVDQSISRIRPDGRVLDYPLSVKEEVIKAGPVEWARILTSVVKARLFGPKPCNADTYARYWIGTRFYQESGLCAYVRRFYGAPPESVELAFAEKRMGWLAEQGSILKVIARFVRRKTLWPANQSLVRPRSGFSSLYAAARASLESRGVRFQLGSPLSTITQNGDLTAVTVGNNEPVMTRRIISTIPIDRTLTLYGEAPDETLPTLNLTSLFYSFKGQRRFSRPILYNFSDEGVWKRLTMTSDFYGPADGREYFAVEVATRGEPAESSNLDADFRQHVERFKIFDGDLKLEGVHGLDNAYPVYVEGVSKMLHAKSARLKALGVEAFGRQGGFDYQPTARTATNVAEETLGAPVVVNAKGDLTFAP